MRLPFHLSGTGRKEGRSNPAAFTRIELAVVLAALFLVSLVALPLLANSSRSDQASCLNNLRQIGIGFQGWGNDHEDRRPWFVSLSDGGSVGHVLRDNAYFQYTFLSNQISPGILMDPAEVRPNKRRAVNWSSSPEGGFLNPSFKNNAVSYMLGVHTTLSEAHEILSADRHVQFDGAGGCFYGFSLVQFLSPALGSFRGWTNGPHGIAGNVLINDGRVEYTSRERLRAVLRPDTSDAPNSSHFLAP